ncbi:hypothetical protein AJ80_06897 [Polytolypa hystricis UAMH7299]|uniref:Carbohydrate kinase PfkB domain-containing protein n=1 Tax=Polytolypa hystricis (strain UAMH7299) TaxID=1447883 RepID=A0A2B7XTF6_POLH7|nr:hypothetical protein AJ80_06897 [Polytolypa hystricis UAMH7299]
MRALVAVGACYLDAILTVHHYPDEDEKLRASSISRRRGGNVMNSLEVLQQLFECRSSTNNQPSVPLYAVAVLPARSSVAIEEIKASLGSSVGIQHCIHREDCSEPASSYIIKSQSTGSRTIVNYNELLEMTTEEFIQTADKLPDGPKWFHFEGRIPEVTLQCIQYLRRNYPDHKVSVELEKPGRAGLQELATEADVVFYSKSWAQGNGHQSAEELLQEQCHLTPQASILCCTWGEKGAVGLDKQREIYIHSSASTDPQHPIVDTIGAGDTFIAGMLYAFLSHGDNFNLQRAMDFANRLAGRKVTQEGFGGLGTAVAHYL